MRKSKPTQKLISGNASKYDSYREAWSRIRLAKENGFFLEAIVIQESIISDRLISYLSCSTKDNSLSNKNHNGFTPLNNLIQRWSSDFPNGLPSGEYPDLISAVNEWRCFRNEAVHNIVKSKTGNLTQSIDLFLQTAKEAAEKGNNLTREVCNWSKKQKRGIEKGKLIFHKV